MSNLARQELFFGRFQSVDEMMEGIERVDAAQVQTIANDFFSGKQVGVTGLGRVSGIELAPAELVV
jgi:predicted Zn-dependent peptidase